MFLILAQIPPPIHGAAVINQKATQIIKSLYPESQSINISTANSISDVGRLSTAKLLKTIKLFTGTIKYLRDPKIKYCYINLHPTGKVFFRDAALCLISKAFRKNTIIHLHGRGIPKKQPALMEYIYKKTFKNTEVIHLSEIFYEEVSRFVKKENFTAIPNCTEDRPDLATFKAGEKIKFYYLSNYMRGKGALDLLNAAKQLYHHGINCQFSLAGGWFDPEFKEELEAWQKENKHLFECGYIKIHGPLHGKEKNNLIKDSDVFVFPSHIDTFPLVVLEALSAGKLIISTATGATPEILENGSSGILIPEKNHFALAEKISFIIKNPSIIQEFSIAARNRYLENYTEETFKKNFTQKIQDIIKKNTK